MAVVAGPVEPPKELPDVNRLDESLLERGLMTIVADMVPDEIPDEYAKIIIQLAFSGLRDTVRLTGEHETTVVKVRNHYKDLIDQIKMKKAVFIQAMILNLEFRGIKELENRMEGLSDKNLVMCLSMLARVHKDIQMKLTARLDPTLAPGLKHIDKQTEADEQDEIAEFVDKMKQKAVMKQREEKKEGESDEETGEDF